jgi:predicted phage terminase large subunit-like protein
VVSEDVRFDRDYVRRFGLYGFLKLAWPRLKPGTPFVDSWHIREICNHLEAVSCGLINRLVINVPPGSSKSVTTSICWPAYVWGPQQQQGKKWIFASYAPKLSGDLARESRELIDSEWYQARWPVALIGQADTSYRNAKAGWRFSTSIRGEVTGRHADIQVVDDPIKPISTQGTAAVTGHELEFVQQWWAGTMSTRMADPKTAARVIIMQRLHEDDLAGHVLESGEYTHLCFPMRFDAARPCRTVFGGDPRKADGELLSPGRWAEAEVRKLENDLGVYASAQLQQRPAAAGGMIFKESWFQYYDALPDDLDEWACSWDMTFKDTLGSDYVCGQVWARKGADFYLVERVYERLNFPNTLTAFQAQLRRFPQIGLKLIEDKANGPAVISTLQRKIPGIVAVEPEGGKVARANGISYLHRAGNVHYPRAYQSARAKTDHVPCMTGFPLAKNDDSVDAETQMLTHWAAQYNTLIDTLERLRKEQAA